MDGTGDPRLLLKSIALRFPNGWKALSMTHYYVLKREMKTCGLLPNDSIDRKLYQRWCKDLWYMFRYLHHIFPTTVEDPERVTQSRPPILHEAVCRDIFKYLLNLDDFTLIALIRQTAYEKLNPGDDHGPDDIRAKAFVYNLSQYAEDTTKQSDFKLFFEFFIQRFITSCIHMGFESIAWCFILGCCRFEPRFPRNQGRFPFIFVFMHKQFIESGLGPEKRRGISEAVYEDYMTVLSKIWYRTTWPQSNTALVLNTARVSLDAKTDLYARLDVPRNATSDEIGRAFRLLALIHHPDKGGRANEYTLIKEAYDTLFDQKKRDAYDKNLRSKEGLATGPLSAVIRPLSTSSRPVFSSSATSLSSSSSPSVAVSSSSSVAISSSSSSSSSRPAPSFSAAASSSSLLAVTAPSNSVSSSTSTNSIFSSLFSAFTWSPFSSSSSTSTTLSLSTSSSSSTSTTLSSSASSFSSTPLSFAQAPFSSVSSTSALSPASPSTPVDDMLPLPSFSLNPSSSSSVGLSSSSTLSTSASAQILGTNQPSSFATHSSVFFSSGFQPTQQFTSTQADVSSSSTVTFAPLFSIPSTSSSPIHPVHASFSSSSANPLASNATRNQSSSSPSSNPVPLFAQPIPRATSSELAGLIIRQNPPTSLDPGDTEMPGT